MNFIELYKTIERNKYYVFSYEDLLSFYPEENKESLKAMLYRWKQKGWLCSLKRGLYEITYPKDFFIPDMYISNVLYSPSYVSLETALSNYSIIPEVSMNVTSITTKPTRRFRNKHGLFIYRTVKRNAFAGYHIEKHQDFNVRIAEPEKAFIDFLYFKSFRSEKFDISEERINKDSIAQMNKRKLSAYAKLYNMELKKFYAYL
jgi:predicted transcriptional regulator of viral defense system